MDRRSWMRVIGLSLPPVLLWLWMLVPALQPVPQRVTGEIRTGQACLIWCSPVVSVGSARLSCQADFLGLPYACAPRWLKDGQGSATYFRLPTLSGVLGLAPTDGVLLELQRDGEVVFRRSVRQQVVATLYGGWMFHAVYWPIVGLIIWRWPDSRISRRAQWLPSRPPQR
jgi:hypothetical protein